MKGWRLWETVQRNKNLGVPQPGNLELQFASKLGEGKKRFLVKGGLKVDVNNDCRSLAACKYNSHQPKLHKLYNASAFSGDA